MQSSLISLTKKNHTVAHTYASTHNHTHIFYSAGSYSGLIIGDCMQTVSYSIEPIRLWPGLSATSDRWLSQQFSLDWGNLCVSVFLPMHTYSTQIYQYFVCIFQPVDLTVIVSLIFSFNNVIFNISQLATHSCLSVTRLQNPAFLFLPFFSQGHSVHTHSGNL